ncbi:hypothetical protein CVU75_02520 [Candidatus Dependentiae bacterium HGW-Dependentiae-1]|nr:MAG: hypothetical protein CVU75_02520 [Candidatus Dependentiae bacterium HGW-Dependentiae-1]
MSKANIFFVFLSVFSVFLNISAVFVSDLYSLKQKLVEAQHVADTYRQQMLDAVAGGLVASRAVDLLVQNSDAVIPVLTEVGVFVPSYADQLKPVLEAINEKFANLYDFSAFQEEYQVKIIEAFSLLDDGITSSIQAVEQEIVRMKKDVETKERSGDVLVSGSPREFELSEPTVSALINRSVLSDDAKKKLRDTMQKEAYFAQRFLRDKEMERIRALGEDGKDFYKKHYFYPGASIYYIEHDFWCPCPHAPMDLRRDLIIRIVEDVLQTRKNKMEPLRVTSFASGNFGQEYLTIKALMDSGYRSIVVNAIDTAYAATDAVGLKRVRLLEELLRQHAAQRGAWVVIDTYDSIANYVEKRSSEEKSDILMMVDTMEFSPVKLRAEFLDLAKKEISLFKEPLVYELNDYIRKWELVDGHWREIRVSP